MATSQGLPRTVAQVCHSMAHDLFGGYRPELHYMRGPGPKWREKHDVTMIDDIVPVAELVYARAS